MLSYHRVLKVFGRSVNDKTLECDCDIHPWEITVNSEMLPGKVRLIGFVDVFFIISYSAKDSFIRGIIVYKDPKALKSLGEKKPKEQNEKSGKNEQKLADESTNENPTEPSQAATVENTNGDTNAEEEDGHDPYEGYYHDPSGSDWDTDSSDDEKNEKPFRFKQRSVYTVRSLGHEIFLKTTFPTTSIQSYTVEINRPDNWAMSRRMRRALKSHGTGRMIQDVVRCGLITQWLLTSPNACFLL